MLSALNPTDDAGRLVNRECIYDNCRFFHVEKRDCTLMMASRAMLDLAAHPPQAPPAGTSPPALADMEKRFTEVGRGLLHSSMEMQEIVRQVGQDHSSRMT